VVINNVPPLQAHAQSTPQAQQQEPKPPVLDPIDTKIEKVSINIDGELQEKSDLRYQDDNLSEVDFAFAEFNRGVDGSPEPWVDVRAQIQFFDTDENLLFRVRDAHWRKATGEYATFRTGEWDELIIAVVGNGKTLPYTGQYKTIQRFGLRHIKQFKVEGKALEVEELRVRIQLIGKRGNTVTLNQTFDYDLITAPKASFRLRKQPLPDQERIREQFLTQLGEFINEGQELASQLFHKQDLSIPQDEINGWKSRVESFLSIHRGNHYIPRFNNDGSLQPSIPDPMFSNEHRLKVIWINRRLERLNEFMAERD